MSDVAKRLTALWEIEETEREKGIKLLLKIYGNILSNPQDPKFRDLNFSKIRKKLDKCRPAFYLLFTAGFTQSVDGQRLKWDNNTITRKQLETANNALNAKINGEAIDDGAEYGGIVAPEETEVITNRNMMIHKKKKEKEKALKAVAAAEAAAEAAKAEPVATDSAPTDPPSESAADSKAESKTDSNEVDPNDGDGDVEMDDSNEAKVDRSEVANELADAGISEDDLKLLEQIKAAKGITVTLVESLYAMHF